MKHQLLQTGIYSISEASHLSGVSFSRIRRWLRGYEFPVRSGWRHSPPVWDGQLKPIDHTLALGFLDLIEVQSVDALREAGVPWKTLRRAHQNAKNMLKHPHPFSSNRFATDGHTVFLSMHDDSKGHILWDMKAIQQVFETIIGPFLRNVEFCENDVASRWWPLGQDREVVLDPRRSFGRPIVARHGVPTAVLAAAVRMDGDVQQVSEWFDISTVEVKDALDFEAGLAA